MTDQICQYKQIILYGIMYKIECISPDDFVDTINSFHQKYCAV